jgi:7-carboxy-7-deazaguanine synthase
MSETTDPTNRLKLIELYASVQGESTHVGRPCTFIRLTGCHLRCTWCDSTYTFKGGSWWSLEKILARVAELGPRLVEVTGGEPLLQNASIPLMRALLDEGYEVLLETSGASKIDLVPEGVQIIMDLKPPDSGEEGRNIWENLDHLDARDELKFVIASRRDYEWSRDVVRSRQLEGRLSLLFSPAWGLLEPRELVDWIMEDGLDVRFQIQMHKVVWPAAERGV